MAFVTTAHGEQSIFARMGHAIAQGLVAYMERQSRQEQIRALDAKSDAELADMGLTRDGIVRHVFRDRFYI
ncbi:hypothetical protein BMI91_15025 [Thioclava sediminum]|uniref:DUF1127 domain-containing protein n=1 Tax=Thioclava sediminum TaxID=1915319 RepID=A0ABX3MVV1_9RHOB|nr:MULTISPECIES: DUF1127 domain-containing protein [Thioclava]MAQ36838.1 DUF1127 domain-containing protein [Thioclava sp.]OOY23766.1 hypothetical protein BMI91_15025 [Thioclava sediminum]|tara:strand:- start:51 stop:263 length:213 start_codon:yes stop_codon:yes gene_type:complete